MPGLNLTRDEALARAGVISEVTRYDIELDLTRGDTDFGSRTRVEFTAAPGGAAFADLVSTNVRSIKLNDRDLDPGAHHQDSRISLDDLAEHNVLEVDADCQYMHTGEGLHRFVDPADGKAYTYSQFEVPDARRVYTTFEQPDLKSTFTLTVKAPKGWKVFSNAPTPSPEEDGDSWTYRFATTEKMSTYITAVVAGPYEGVTDTLTSSDGRTIDLGVYCRASVLEHLDADAIILDEVSMMDIVLMEHFLEAVPEGARVIFVGDVDQLPAVGPGSVLKDILRSGAVPSVRLKEVFRQSGEGTIVLNAHAINRGRMPQFTAGGDFEFLEMPDEETAARRIVALCREELPREGFSALEAVQVLSPMHRTPCGVDNLNRLLQAALNPPAPEKAEFRNSTLTFRVGDKVMQTKNDYTKGVFNGDIGFIREVSADGVKVRYSEELTADYEPNELMMLTLAYAMSVHKSQGSEYPVIVLPLVAAHHIMLQRNLLYTAVTRAKKKVVLLGSKAAVFTAVSNDKTRRRYTLLAERLAGAGGESPLLS